MTNRLLTLADQIPAIQATFELFLIQRCTIRRAAVPVLRDAYGHRDPAWTAQYTWVKCRCFNQAELIARDERKDAVPVNHYLMLVMADTDIQEQDRIQVDGDDHEYTVRSISERQLANFVHHKSVQLLRVGD